MKQDFQVRGDRRRAKRVANVTRMMLNNIRKRGEATQDQVAFVMRIFRRERTLRMMMKGGVK